MLRNLMDRLTGMPDYSGHWTAPPTARVLSLGRVGPTAIAPPFEVEILTPCRWEDA